MDRFSKLQDQIHQLNSTIGGEWEPHWQLLWLVEELGEVSRELQKLQDLPAKLHNDSVGETQQKLKEEIGDVLYGLVSFCKNVNIDILDALEISLHKFQKRHS